MSAMCPTCLLLREAVDCDETTVTWRCTTCATYAVEELER